MGTGGWAAIVVVHGKIRAQLSGGERDTTNNRMELTAAIAGIEMAPKADGIDIASDAIVLVSDSQYVVTGMNVWVRKWIENGWKGSRGGLVLNRDLWVKLYRVSKHKDITWQWTKSHSADVWNNTVDAIATQEIEKITMALAWKPKKGTDVEYDD